jgi:hypothetical protein
MEVASMRYLRPQGRERRLEATTGKRSCCPRCRKLTLRAVLFCSHVLRSFATYHRHFRLESNDLTLCTVPDNSSRKTKNWTSQDVVFIVMVLASIAGLLYVLLHQ